MTLSREGSIDPQSSSPSLISQALRAMFMPHLEVVELSLEAFARMADNERMANNVSISYMVDPRFQACAYWSLASKTMRTARAITSGERFGDFLIMAPFSIEGALLESGGVQSVPSAAGPRVPGYGFDRQLCGDEIRGRGCLLRVDRRPTRTAADRLHNSRNWAARKPALATGSSRCIPAHVPTPSSRSSTPIGAGAVRRQATAELASSCKTTMASIAQPQRAPSEQLP